MIIKKIISDNKVSLENIHFLRETLKKLEKINPYFGWDILQDNTVVQKASDIDKVKGMYLYTQTKDSIVKNVCVKLTKQMDIKSIEKYLAENKNISLPLYSDIFRALYNNEDVPPMKNSLSLEKANAETNLNNKFLKITFIGCDENKEVVVITVKHSNKRLRVSSEKLLSLSIVQKMKLRTSIAELL